MSKKSVKTTKPSNSINSKPNVNRSGRFYPVEREELELPQTRVKKATAGGKNVLKPSEAMKVEFSPGRATSQSLTRLVPAKPAKQARPVNPPAQSTVVEVVNVSFVLIRPGASQVSLCGQFNGWSPEAGPMTRQEDGHWEAIVALRPGRYEYKFLVDGEWLADPVVTQTVPNGYGSVNSVIEVWAS